MKSLIICLAVVALAVASDNAARKEIRDEKPVRLPWPMPDPLSEGDLMLHGSISYERVRELYKLEKQDDLDKVVLAHGRLFLRRVVQFFDEHADFKVSPVICRDSRTLNSSISRWRMELIEAPSASNDSVDAEKPKEIVQHDDPLPKEKGEKQPEKAEDQPQFNNNASLANETETTTSVKPTDKPSEINSTEKPIEQPLTTLKPEISGEKVSFEVRQRQYYRTIGSNFANLLMRESRKELSKEETEYLARWLADEAVHYGAMAIYCKEGENIKEITKQMAVFLEEKAQ